MKIERILYPTDFSEQSVAALDYACELATSFGAKLHIVYVDDLTDLIAKSPYVCPSFVRAIDRSEVKAQLKEVLPTVGNVSYVHHFLEGEAAAAICALAEKEEIDLIVMSSHGRSGLPRLLLGSVAEEVLRHAICPVLIVKQSAGKPADTSEVVAAGCSHA